MKSQEKQTTVEKKHILIKSAPIKLHSDIEILKSSIHARLGKKMTIPEVCINLLSKAVDDINDNPDTLTEYIK